MIRELSKQIAAFALFSALAAASAAQADDGFLKEFEGPWRGTGAVRTGADKPQDKLVCRVDGSVDTSGEALELSGRCGSEKFNGSFKIKLTYNPASGRYSAVWRDSLGSQSPPLTGLRSGNRLVFKVRHNDFETDGRAVSTLVVDPESSRFRIVGRTMPETGSSDFVSADLIFVRG